VYDGIPYQVKQGAGDQGITAELPNLGSRMAKKQNRVWGKRFPQSFTEWL